MRCDKTTTAAEIRACAANRHLDEAHTEKWLAMLTPSRMALLDYAETNLDEFAATNAAQWKLLELTTALREILVGAVREPPATMPIVRERLRARIGENFHRPGIVTGRSRTTPTGRDL